MKSLLLSLALALFAIPANAGTLIHDGSAPMQIDVLCDCIVTGIRATGHTETNYRIALLLETAAAESRLGMYAIKARAKGSHGIFQILTSTAEDTLEWFNTRYHDDWLEFMSVLYDEDMTMRQNLEYNVCFSAGIAALIYYRMARTADISTREKRAALWKRVYNTPLGAGTEKIYLQRAKECLDADAE